jgi:hypothetical protein
VFDDDNDDDSERIHHSNFRLHFEVGCRDTEVQIHWRVVNTAPGRKHKTSRCFGGVSASLFRIDTAIAQDTKCSATSSMRSQHICIRMTISVIYKQNIRDTEKQVSCRHRIVVEGCLIL